MASKTPWQFHKIQIFSKTVQQLRAANPLYFQPTTYSGILPTKIQSTEFTTKELCQYANKEALGSITT